MRFTRAASLLFFLTTGTLLGATPGCSDSYVPVRVCTPGANVFCRCADRATGTKRCNNVGDGFDTDCRLGENLPCREAEEDAGPQPVVDAGIDAPNLCSNGAVDTNEACDDGNKADGDLCSSKCEPLGDPVQAGKCPGMPVHLWGDRTVEISGYTALYQNSHEAKNPCNGLSLGLFGNDRVYAVTPHRKGKLVVDAVNTDFDVVLFVNSTCADSATEVACANATSEVKPEHLELPVNAGTTYYVILDGGAIEGSGKATMRFALQ